MSPPLVCDIISEHFLALPPYYPLGDALNEMAMQKSSSIVVVADVEPLGIITESDTVGLLAESFAGICWLDLTVAHVMSSPVISVCGDLSIYDAMAVARGGRIRHIPVIDSEGVLFGVLNQTQMIQAISEMYRM